MDEKRTNKIRTVRDLKVYRKAIRNGEESRYLLSSLLLATYRAVARRAKTEEVIFRPSVVPKTRSGHLSSLGCPKTAKRSSFAPRFS